MYLTCSEKSTGKSKSTRKSIKKSGRNTPITKASELSVTTKRKGCDGKDGLDGNKQGPSIIWIVKGIPWNSITL